MKAIIKTKAGPKFIEKSNPLLSNAADVIIKIELSGLCYTDLYAAQNLIPIKKNVTLGHEFTGKVIAIGNEVQNVRVDDRVAVMPMIENTSMLGIDLDGAYAEYICVPARAVFAIPATLNLQEAAFIEPIAASLAVLNAPINNSQIGLIYGKNRVAELTLRILHAYGFDKVYKYDAQNQCEHDNTYDFIIESISTAKALSDMIRLVKSHGLIILKSRFFKKIPILIKSIVQKNITLQGVHYGNFQESINLLYHKKIQVSDLFGEIYSLNDAPSILANKLTLLENKKIFFLHEGI